MQNKRKANDLEGADSISKALIHMMAGYLCAGKIEAGACRFAHKLKINLLLNTNRTGR